MRKKHIATRKRNGVFLLDVCVGLAVLAVVIFVLMQAVFQLGEHRKDRRMRQIAVDTLLNAEEMLDFDETTDSEAFRKRLESLQKTAGRALPDGRLDVVALPQSPAENLKLIEIAVSYDDGAHRPRREFSLLRLVAVSESDEKK